MHDELNGSGMVSSVRGGRGLPRVLRWTPAGRAGVFVLAAASIWCLLSEMYGLCDMRTFTLRVLIPATAVLYGWAVADRRWGDGRLFRAVMIGTVGGLVAAAAYDVFRLPFVFSRGLGLDGLGVPALPLYKVFPRFGAMILGQSVEQDSYSAAAQVIGWAYHFSNGATFGVMFTALIGESVGRWRGGWPWAVAMAVGIEAGLLLSPYAGFFSIPVTATFVAVTLTAHVVFGMALGVWVRGQSRRWVVAPVRAGR